MSTNNVTEAIDSLSATLGTMTDAVILLALLLIPLGLTVAMFLTHNPLLGFPSALFWAIFGGYCYTQSAIAWGDIYYYLAFGSLLGMTTFTALGAYSLREKRDTIAEAEIEKGEEELIDEDEESQPSRRTKKLRERAEMRRKRR